MEAGDLRLGMPVTIAAKDEFYAFVDGWQGTFAGWRDGYPVVEVIDDGIRKEFLVPADQLRETKHGSQA